MGKFNVPAPEDVAGLETDALSAAVEEALAEFGTYNDIADADITDEQIAEMSALHGFVEGATAELSAREVAAAERAATLASLRESMAKKPAEGSPAEEQQESPAEEQQEEETDKKKMSATKTSFAARAASNSAAPKAPAKPQGSLVAAAEVPGYAAGHKFDSFRDAADAILSRLKALPTSGPENTRIRNGALTIKTAPTEFSQANEVYRNRDTELLLDASNEARLPGGSLVAAGGWGAPSVRNLDFCELENIDGLVSFPEVNIVRGGVQYTKGPTFADVFNATSGFWDMTEAVAEAGTELKTSIRPEVPSFTEVRLDAVGVMMEAGLLLRQGWPELVDRYASLLTTAHQVKLAKKSITQVQALCAAPTTISNAFGNAMDIFHILELLAVGERQRLALGQNATLEALIPHWVKPIVRADLAQRTGVDTPSVTDAQIEGYLTARGIKAQWITFFQDIALDATTGLALSYPDTVEVIFYPAGAFVRGTAPVITLDTVYDSTNLKKNDYVHLFMEQGVLMTNPCANGHRVNFPLYANGRRAGFTDNATGMNDNLFQAPVA